MKHLSIFQRKAFLAHISSCKDQAFSCVSPCKVLHSLSTTTCLQTPTKLLTSCLILSHFISKLKAKHSSCLTHLLENDLQHIPKMRPIFGHCSEQDLATCLGFKLLKEVVVKKFFPLCTPLLKLLPCDHLSTCPCTFIGLGGKLGKVYSKPQTCFQYSENGMGMVR